MILTHFVGSLECQLCQRLATPLDAMRRLELQRGSQTTMIWVANDDASLRTAAELLSALRNGSIPSGSIDECRSALVGFELVCYILRTAKVAAAGVKTRSN
jgi:hypothetical protein